MIVRHWRPAALVAFLLIWVAATATWWGIAKQHTRWTYACGVDAAGYANFIVHGDPEMAHLDVKVGACALAALPHDPLWACELHDQRSLAIYALPLVKFSCD